MKKILLANGCSLVEGSEIGNKQFNYDESIDGPNTGVAVFHLMSQEHIDHMKSNNWASLLAKKLNIPFESLAMGGSSNRRIARTTMLKVDKLLKTYKPEEILVVIGFSDMSRYEVFFDTTGYKPFVINHTFKGQTKEEKEILKGQENKCESLVELFTAHFLELLVLKHYLEAKKVDYFFTYGLVQNVIYEYGEDKVDALLSKFEDASQFLDLLEFKNTDKWYLPHADFNEHELGFIKNLYQSCFYFISRNNNFPIGNGFHPLEEAHAHFSEEVFKVLENKYKVPK